MESSLASTLFCGDLGPGARVDSYVAHKAFDGIRNKKTKKAYMISKRAYHRTCLALLALASLIGCSGGQPTYHASGRVTFSDGQPLEGGVVEFRSLDSQPSVSARGFIQADGTFQLTTFLTDDGAVEGKHQVLVSPKRPGSVTDRRMGARRDPVVAEFKPIIDDKFQRFETSGLTFTVTRDRAENQFHIVVGPPSANR